MKRTNVKNESPIVRCIYGGPKLMVEYQDSAKCPECGASRRLVASMKRGRWSYYFPAHDRRISK